MTAIEKNVGCSFEGKKSFYTSLISFQVSNIDLKVLFHIHDK